ncbi:hypothetical protein VRU48_01170 [Pedobacter sp. KR3-3]|uniref:HEAT repeat domain-containing protein n=1 Tax=Pedobacter albus TaxID=3113905 RepID=A0ABU7I2K5_9SPHI|nr:hypothetical protein [Pedobacter sp. KR3-3]MEE1943697.1 hypothetical protein [Pedobacter sp. KR3-3]
MDKIELKTILAQTIGKEKVVYLSNIVANHHIPVKELIDLTFDRDDKVSFRAAWILENVYVGRLEDFLPATSYFLTRFASQNNLSCRRHYGKILALMTKKNAPKAIKDILAQHNLDSLVETAFAWLIDEEVPVAIKSHVLNILANLSAKQDWIRDELLQTMDYLVDKESIAFFAKVKQIRKQLKASS